MRISRTFALLGAFSFAFLAGCNGGSSSSTGMGSTGTSSPPSTAAVNISLHDMPPMGVNILAFRVTVTGATLQPGNISVLNSPVTMEMTQLQSMAAYLNTVSVPAGNYTGMTVTFANPQMTFLNTSGGMMMNFNCPAGQICQITPPMLASSATFSGSPFPLNVQAGTPLGLMMDFDLMDSMQSNMNFSPMMSSSLQQPFSGGGNFGQIFNEMDEMVGVATGVNAAAQTFTVQFMQGAQTLTITVDGNTVFEGFDAIDQPNNFSSLAAGQIVEMDLQLANAGTLHATEVKLEAGTGRELYGMLVGLDSAGGWCDVVVMNEAPNFSGVNVGDEIRANLQAGTTFDMDGWGAMTSGMSFTGFSDLMLGQMIQLAPLSGLASGTPPQVNVNHLRLMSTSVTGTISAKLSATDFGFTPSNGIFPAAGINGMHVSTSSQTRFDNVSGLGGLNVGDTVSLRGPMFTTSGGPTLMATYVLKR